MNVAHYTLASLRDGDALVPALRVADRYWRFADFATGRGQPVLPRDLVGVFADWPRLAPLMDGLAARAATGTNMTGPGVAAAGAALATPLAYPRKCFCVGANYQSHLDEMKASEIRKIPGRPPFFFLKPPSTTFVGPGPTVHLPHGCEYFDWEIELAVVFGRGGRHIREARAMDHVAGFTLACDFTSRNQMFAPETFFKFDFTLGKCQDTTNPVGPAILPAHLVADPLDLEFALWVNGVEKQRARAAEMIYSIPEQIAGVSRFIAIEPGDVMLTGSPAGVGWPRGEKLAPGDVVKLWGAGIGEMEIVIQPPLEGAP
jgi:2-keto-4-pentenoate hydratase/2-oxohepta-3-ene-1,7-dioic acid hydratase in catechol pathway